MKKKSSSFFFRTILYLKGLNRQQSLILASCLVILMIIIFPLYLNVSDSSRSNASHRGLYFKNSENEVGADQIFTVELRVNSPDTAINAVGSLIQIDPRKLEIIGITTDKSFCSFYTDNSFDTIKGEVHIGCGTPNPGFTGDSLVVAMKLRSKSTGETTLRIPVKEAYVLANDGKGTNLQLTSPELPLTILSRF